MNENMFSGNIDANINDYLINPQIDKRPMNPNLVDPKDLTDKYFIEPELKEQKIIVKAESCHCCALIFTSIFCILCSSSLFALDPKAWYAFLINAIVLIIFILCCYLKTFKKLEITKGESSNEVYITAYNCFYCSYKKLKCTNVNFYIGIVNDSLGTNNIGHRLFIMKNFKNLEEIDLNTSSIKNTPVKLYYYFDHIWRYQDTGIERQLNAFVGNPNYECPFQFNINKYMSVWLSEEEKNIFYPPVNDIYSKRFYSQYLKFCDNFFCYYIEKPFSNVLGDILRIDFIYSKDFDILFVGLVNHGEKSYKDTFEFNMATIDIFVLQKISYQDNGFNLKVIYKDKSDQLIYSLKKGTQEELRGLVFLLNERLNGNVNNNNNNIIVKEIPGDNPPTLAATNIK